MNKDSTLKEKDKAKKTILIVDDEAEIRELLYEALAQENYQCITAKDGYDALQRLNQGDIAVVITDIKMPGIDGVGLLQDGREISPDTAFIMITGVTEIDIAVNTLKLGACDYIVKPFNLNDVLSGVKRGIKQREQSIENHLQKESLRLRVKSRTAALNKALREIEESYQMTLEALVSALDAREQETNAHSYRVQQYTLALARKFGIGGQSLVDIGRGALLHDIGKIGISDAILLKPGQLTPEEWVEMKKHPLIGYQILQGIKFLEPAAQIVLTHQEKFDGTGYPQGLKGKQIPLGARIFAVVDTLDAMTSDRPYRKGLSYSDAQEEIRRYSGTQFDNEIVDVFLSMPENEWRFIGQTARSDCNEKQRMSISRVTYLLDGNF